MLYIVGTRYRVESLTKNLRFVNIIFWTEDLKNQGHWR